jgi:hypothetical protein
MPTPRSVVLPLVSCLALAVTASPADAAAMTPASKPTMTGPSMSGSTMSGPTMGGSTMQMTSRQPEHDADALAALMTHNPTAAARDLRSALASHYEPAASKTYARRALTLLGEKKGTQASVPTTDGAAVEHLTWALSALNADQPATASGHLMEAAELPPAAAAAKAALTALAALDNAKAIRTVRGALKSLGA